MDPTTVQVTNSDSSIKAKLYLQGDSTEYSPELDLTLWFYQNGIMRTLLEEPGSDRFRISQEGLPIVNEQLHHVSFFQKKVTFRSNEIVVWGLMSEDMTESFSYYINYDHFKITQYAGSLKTLVINPIDSLYLENENNMHMYSLSDVHRSVSLGFYFPATRLFGLPEREDTFMLKNTGTKPYELFATDQFAH